MGYATSTIGDFYFSARWTEEGHFPTLQPRSKTKLSAMQA